MSIATLSVTRSLSEIRDQLVYMHARLEAHALTTSLAAAAAPLVARIDTVAAGQAAVWDEELRAQAVVDAGNDGLDDAIKAFERDLRHALSDDRSAPAYRRYFPVAPSAILRLGLESELARVREWLPSMTSDTGPANAHAAPLTAAVAAGDAAVARRARAIAATADHRVRQIVPLVDDLNAARTGLHGSLETLAGAHAQPKGFADRFFRHAVRPGAPAAASEPTSHGA